MTPLEFKNKIIPCYATAYATAMSIVRNSEDARDIVQELFSRLWEEHSRLVLPHSPQAFCALAARNAAISWLRANPPGRLAVIDEHTPQIVDDDESAPHEDLLPVALAVLDEKRRKLISKSLQGCSNTELAAMFDTSEVNIRVMLSRTRRALRNILLSLQKQQQ